jgi:hypothetical protein
MTEERRKLVLSILVYTGIIALVAFILFHQSTVKQRLIGSSVQRPQSSSASLLAADLVDPADIPRLVHLAAWYAVLAAYPPRDFVEVGG